MNIVVPKISKRIKMAQLTWPSPTFVPTLGHVNNKAFFKYGKVYIHYPCMLCVSCDNQIFNMISICSPLASYNSLLDPSLQSYFGNPRMRKHLRKAGLVS